MDIHVKSKRASIAKIQSQLPNSVFIDTTSKSSEPWIKFSPFYPHGNIPIPFSPGYYSESVEGIWQGLKVFKTADIDLSKFTISSMKGLKRSVRKYGKVLGHRAGVTSQTLLPYLEARRTIYIPSYKWILENRLQDLVEKITCLGENNILVLLDYSTNLNVNDLDKPLSHAGLIKAYIEGKL